MRTLIANGTVDILFGNEDEIRHLTGCGDLDTCIHIRTVVIKDGVAHVQAGGGTVADAKPEYEFLESEAKAKGVLRAVEMAMEQPDWP